MPYKFANRSIICREVKQSSHKKSPLSHAGNFNINSNTSNLQNSLQIFDKIIFTEIFALVLSSHVIHDIKIKEY